LKFLGQKYGCPNYNHLSMLLVNFKRSQADLQECSLTQLLCEFHNYTSNFTLRVSYSSAVRRNLSWGGFIQWHMVVICLWCAVFVTSQFDVIFMFPNQCFGEVC